VGPLLTGRIRSAYDETAAHLAGVPGVRPLISPSTLDSPGHVVAPTLLAVSAKDLVARAGELLQECFGPAALVIEYDGTDDLFAGLDAVPGSLTAGLHAVPDDWPVATALVERLARRAGRIIYGGWPTGVAVTWAMHHGGPWPATTNPLHTSVGVTAIRRWQRPVAYQDVPEPLLPPELRDGNPLGIPRRVNGRMER